MKTVYYLLFGVFILIALIACKKNYGVISSANVYKISDYPLKLNNQWRYKVTDFYSGTTDTLTLQIISVKSSDSELDWFCTLSEKGRIVDSGKYVQTQTQVSYIGLNKNYSYFGDFIFSFPIAANSLWIGFYPVDTVKLISIDSNLIVNGIKYDDIFYVKRAFYLIGNYSLVQKLQIAPKIGIVEQTISAFNGALPQNQNFSLIDYKLN